MRKILSIILSVTLMLTILPTGLFSITVKAGTSVGGSYGNIRWNFVNSSLVISGNGKIMDYTSSDKSHWGNYISSIKYISIADGITHIGNHAFEYCTNLVELFMADSVVSIGDESFNNCRSLTNISFSNCVESIGKKAFYNCKNIKNLYIGSNVTSIGVDAFSYCSSLGTITLPDTVTTIASGAFDGCKNLTRVYYRGSESDKSKISIGWSNECLENATWVFNSCINKANCAFDSACDTECNDCHKTRTVSHSYDGDCDQKCNICDFTREVFDEHIYDNYCDEKCNICGFITTPKHYYSFECSTICNKCGYIRQATAHTYDNDCDECCNICGFVRTEFHIYSHDCDKYCNICGFVRTVPDHVYNNDCDKDCNICGDMRQASEHKYDNSCDDECNVCCATRIITHTHQIKDIWSFDKTHHWEKCYICGDETAKQTHIFSGNSDATCDTCGYTRLLETVTSQAHLSTVPKGYKGIYNYTDLLNINNNPSDKYILMSDIDVSQCTKSVIVEKEFTGVLNGNGYAIKNFTFNTSVTSETVTAVGIFMKNSGTVCNLTVQNFSSIIVLEHKKSTAFLGIITTVNNGTIRNCSIVNPKALCSGNNLVLVAGIAADNESTGKIEHCSVFEDSLSSSLLSATTSSYLSNSDSALYCGGITASNEGKIYACYTDAGLSVGNAPYFSVIGGISGDNSGEIADCYSSSSIAFETSSARFGGIAGYNASKGKIKNTYYDGYCYQSGNTSYRVSLISRESTGTIQNSYCMGGFASAICQYGTNCTELQFSKQSTFAGFDFANIWIMGSWKPSLRSYKASKCIEGNAHSGGLNCCVASKICEVCGAVYGQTGDHVYSQWYTVYESTCSSNGLKVKNCLYCGDETIEEIALSNHSYDNSCDISCNVCDATRNITHTYTNSCDTICNACGHTRTIVHTYSNNCDSSCNVCGYTRTVGEHVYSNACDTTCNECGHGRTTQHVYENELDMICNVCAYDRSIPTKITSSKHTISGNKISKITAGTTVSKLLDGINEGKYCKVYKDGAQVGGDKAVGTGMVVKIMDGNTIKASYTVIVTGDTNGDGNITITDMIAIKAHVLKKSTLSGVYATAADTNGDNGISITDFIQVKAKILGKGTITAR